MNSESRERSLLERIQKLELLGVHAVSGLLLFERHMIDTVHDKPSDENVELLGKIKDLTALMLKLYD